MIFSIIKNIKDNTSAKIITNTVLTTININEIEQMVQRLIAINVDGIMIWNYWPMAETDKLDLLVSLEAWCLVQKNIIVLIQQANVPFYLRGFPKCLLQDGAAYVQGDYPVAIASEKLWQKIISNKYMCNKKSLCVTNNCAGVSMAYVNKFGRCDFVPYV
jgi:MoaA/NifB/PqqE/SkfB family radical SAM enzyme